MRIGFDAKRIFHNTTGLGNYSRDTVRVLSEEYPTFIYYLYNPKPGKVKRLSLKGNMKVCLPKQKIWQKLNSLWRQKAIVKDLIKDNVEVYHGLTNELPIGIEKTTIKTVVTIHDLIFLRYPELYSFIDVKIHYKKFKRAAQVADKVIAISEQTKKDIVNYLGVSETKIEVVYQGCHSCFQEDYKPEHKEQVQKKYKLPSKYLLNVGTIQKRKNLLTIVKAIQNTKHNLVVIGKETAYAQEVKQFINNNNMKGRVLFLSGVNMQELAIIYQKASIFIYPSIFEGFGIPIIEALYSKTPVISTKGGCFTEAGGPNSLYIEPCDEIAMLQAIFKIESDIGLQQEMKEKGWNYAQQFKDEKIAFKLKELYNNL